VNEAQGTYNWPPSGIETRDTCGNWQSNQEVLAHGKDRNRFKNKRGWDPQVPGPQQGFAK